MAAGQKTIQMAHKQFFVKTVVFYSEQVHPTVLSYVPKHFCATVYVIL